MGTSAYIFDYTDPEAMYTAFYPNPNYYMSRTEVTDHLENFFYWFGDVTKDGRADVSDLVEHGLGWGAIDPDPRYVAHADADLVYDTVIDIEDARVTGYAYGKKRTY
jgi:hypothetical protein